MNYQKYPRIPHVPWSHKVTDDDIQVNSIGSLKNKMIVVTEKLDGENTTMYQNKIHARTIDSKDHYSRHYIKAIHGIIKFNIPSNIRIVGENCFAKHSIYYDNMPAVFFGFSVIKDGIFLNWDDTKNFFSRLGLATVPILYKGFWNEDKIKKCFTGVSKFGPEQEGYVIRNADSFSEKEFSNNVFKFVRKNHVQIDDHWLKQPLIMNKVKV